MRTVLLLEDNLERVAAFKAVVRELGADWQLRLWHDAPTMLRECSSCLSDAALISLDHDLNPQPGATADPGTGFEVARFLAGHLPFCPLIIHSSNADRAWSMHNELRFAGWTVDRVGPIGQGWVEKLWLPKARAMIASPSAKNISFKKPADHQLRMERALLSLEGLALGDAIGEMLSYRHASAHAIIAQGLAAGPWFRTDDSEMAISIAEILNLYGYINQDALARRFAWRFEQDPERGYGKMTRIQLREMIAGAHWRDTAARAFGGQGSMGNGAAMRVAPLGAYWADDIGQLVSEAENSAKVTHSHAEGIAGAIAVATAAAAAVATKSRATRDSAERVF
ncbi:MAG: ADP-ribosylglycohydrolase family protein [Limisphaerales bacterium]